MWRITAVCRLMRMLYYMYVRYSSGKLDNIHHPAICVCIFLHFFHSIYVRNLAISSSNSSKTSIFSSLLPKHPYFQSNNMPSLNILCNQIYHGIDGTLSPSSKYGKHLLVIKNHCLGGLEPVRKREIFWMNNSFIYSKYLDIIFFHWLKPLALTNCGRWEQYSFDSKIYICWLRNEVYQWYINLIGK